MKRFKTPRFGALAGVLVLGGLSLGSGFGSAFAVEPAMTAPTATAAKVAPLDLKTLAPVSDDVPFFEEINAFLKADQEQMPPTGAVLFAGSSSIRAWRTLAQDFPEIPVINRGFGGSRLVQNTQLADRIAIPYQPKMIVLFAGTNDLAAGKPVEEVVAGFKDYVAKIRASLPDTRIIFLSITPTRARWRFEPAVMETNYLIQKWIFENNSPANKLTFINAHDQLLTPDGQPPDALAQKDGLHFNAEGYKVWKAIIKPRILALAEMDGVQRLDAPTEPAKIDEPLKTQ